MSRRTRWVVIAIGALLLLPLLAVLVLFINPNQFRPRIESAARSELGLPLALRGELRWSWWPLLNLQSDGGEILADAGPPLLRWEQLQFGLRLRPLLQRQMVVDRVAITGLEVRLQRDAAGRGNWQNLLDRLAPSGTAANSGGSALRIAGVQLQRARLEYSDEQNGSSWRVVDLDMETDIDQPNGNWAFSDLDLSATVGGSPLPAAGVPLTVSIDELQLQTAPLQVTLPSAELRVAGTRLLLQQTQPLQFDPFVGAGRIELQLSSLRQAAQSFGIELPATQSRDAFGALRLASGWQSDGRRVLSREFTLKADATQFDGQLLWPLDDTDIAAFELTGDALDVDAYLPPPEAPQTPFELPVEALRAIEVNGSVTFRSMNMRGMTVRGARFEVQSDREGVSARRARIGGPT